MSSGHLAGLPFEVWHMVCGQLDFEQLVNARLACKSLSIIGAEYLVRNITFHTSMSSLNRLQLLAQHPHLRKGVTHVIYEGSLIQDSLDFKSFKDLHHNRVEHKNYPRSRVTRQAYQKYQELAQSQTQLIDNVAVRNELFRCIVLFPNLTSLTVTNTGGGIGLSARFKESFVVDPFVPLQYAKSHAIWQVQNCLVPGLTKIKINSVDPQFFDGLSGRTNLWLRDSFSALREIHLILAPAEGTRSQSAGRHNLFSAIRKGHLKHALAAARQLQTLHFFAYDQTHDGRNTINLGDVFGDTVWPELTRLDFFALDCKTEDEIMGVLSRQPKLAKLGFAFCPLIQGKWASVFRKMRNSLRLDSLYMEGQLEDEWGVLDLDLYHRTAWKKAYRVTLDTMLEMYVIGAAMPPWYEDRTGTVEKVQAKSDNNGAGYNPLDHLDEDFGDAEELQLELGGPVGCVLNSDHEIVEWDGMFDDEDFDSEGSHLLDDCDEFWDEQ